MGKELLSGSATAKHAVASVIQAAEKAQITTPSPELRLACYEGTGKRKKKKKGVKQITFEEPASARTDLFELEQSPQCCCSVLDAKSLLSVSRSSFVRGSLMMPSTTFATMKIIISE